MKQTDDLNLNLRVIEWQKVRASINTLCQMTYTDGFSQSKFKSLSYEYIQNIESEDLWGG